MCGSTSASENANTSNEAVLVKPKILEVHGDYFNSDTRTICTMLELSNKSYTFNQVDTFTG